MIEKLKIFEDFENCAPWVEPARLWLKHYPNKIPKYIKYDPITVHDLIRLAAEMYPTTVSMYYVPDERKYTYRETLINANKISNALIQKLNIKKGDSVAIMTENVPEFIFSIIGIMQTGASVTPINPLLNETDVAHIIKDSGIINTIFIHSKNYRTIKKAMKNVNIDNIILIGSSEAKEDTITIQDFMNESSSLSPPKITIDPLNDTATLLYTGGTTGLPKGVMLSHENIVSDVLNILYMNKDRYGEGLGREATLAVLPLCHTFGFTVAMVSLIVGSMMIMMGDFNPNKVMKLIQDYKIKLFTGVPVMFQMLVTHPDFNKYDLSSLESSISGSAALSPEIAQKWAQGTNNIKVAQGFGLTEASPVTHMQTRWLPEIKPDSVGIPLLNTDAKIIDPETFKELNPGEVGELLIRGPQVMKGYWNNSEATKKVITEEGWLRTGDLARIDEDGYFYIEGRMKDIIKYKGYKVMPKEVEEKLEKHPAISSAGVVGIPDPDIGETIKAFIVLEKEYIGKINEQDIIEWAKENMAGYKYPRQIQFIQVLPRTAIGKIHRLALKKK
ncbi:MAG: AMP-binding protein [Candidatus Hodarchaeota archaeon]